MSKIMFVISPSLNALSDPRKGTSGNKIDCASHHFGNSLRSNIEIGAAAGVTALVGRAAVKAAAKKAAAVAVEAAPVAAEGAAAVAKKPNVVKKFIEYFKAAPTWLKGTAYAVMGLSLLARTYKKGKIEQKYEDRAQFVDNTFKRETLSAAALKKEAKAEKKEEAKKA